MKILVASEHSTTGNIVRGAFHEMKVASVEIIACKTPEETAAKAADCTAVLVDWVYEDALGTQIVEASKKAAPNVPILLLATKQRGGTTFAGMKAGATGVISKPIQPEDLVRSVASSIKALSGKKATVNVEFINPFIDATRNVFSTMCGVDAQRKKLFLKDDHKMLGDVSGVMGLTGAATGSVVVSFPKRLACLMVGRMLGEPPADDLNSDVCDGVGEIINMISGQAKAMLVKTKYHFTISIPSVISGQGHEISHKKGTPNIVVLFEADGMDFALQVCLAPTMAEE